MEEINNGGPAWKPIKLKGNNNVDNEEETLLYGNAGINLDNVNITYDDGDLARKVREAVQKKYFSKGENTPLSTNEEKDDDLLEDEKLAKELLEINTGEKKSAKKSKKSISKKGGEIMDINTAVNKVVDLLMSTLENKIRTAQQAELGEKAEKEIEGEKDLEAGKKDLGEVKLPGVKVQETSSPKTAQQAELGEKAEKEIESEKNLEAGKKDLGEVKTPKPEISVTSSPVETVKQKEVKMPSTEPQKEVTTSKEEAEEAKKGTKTAQQAELGEKAEKEIESEKDLQAGKKDLGEVKLPGVKVQETSSPKTAQQAELGEKAEKEIESEKDLQAGKKDLGEVKLPGIKVVEKGAYTAQFIKQPEKKDSYWKVSLDKKPIFAVSFGDAFGTPEEVIKKGRLLKSYLKDYEAFISEDYGRSLLDEVTDIGIKGTIDKWFRDDNGKIRVSFYKASQEEAPKMSLDEKVTETLIPEEGTEKGEKKVPIEELVANVLASLIVSSEEITVDEVISQLKSIFSDEKFIERFLGTLKEKVSAMSEKMKKEEPEVKEEIKTITSMFKSAQFSNIITDYMKRIRSEKSEVNSKIDEYLGKLKEVEKEKESLKAKVAKLEQQIAIQNKSKKVAELVKKMIKKGMLDEKDAKQEIEKLMKRSDEALQDLSDMIEKIAVKEQPRKVLGKVNTAIPISNIEEKKEESGGIFDELFSKPPIVDENKRTLKIVK